MKEPRDLGPCDLGPCDTIEEARAQAAWVFSATSGYSHMVTLPTGNVWFFREGCGLSIDEYNDLAIVAWNNHRTREVAAQRYRDRMLDLFVSMWEPQKLLPPHIEDSHE